jgi:hypothetical protein
MNVTNGRSGVVVVSSCKDWGNPQCHESVTQGTRARKLAAIKGYEFAGEFDAAQSYSGPVYFVPAGTLIANDTAQRFGVRGDFDALLGQNIDGHLRTAIAQARRYHGAALACYPGMFASRCNYDIAQGRDEQGGWHAGVLEQSWRIGGASGAELAALAAFQADSALKIVAASTTEIYDDKLPVPTDACIYFQGVDQRVGPLTKYARCEIHVDTR